MKNRIIKEISKKILVYGGDIKTKKYLLILLHWLINRICKCGNFVYKYPH